MSDYDYDTAASWSGVMRARVSASVSGCHFDDDTVTLRHRELVDEAAWARLASGRRRSTLRPIAARLLRLVAAWLDEQPEAVPGGTLAGAR